MRRIILAALLLLVPSITHAQRVSTTSALPSGTTIPSPSITGTVSGGASYTAPTLTTPVLSGTITGTYTLGGTPTITGAVSTSTVTLGSGTGTGKLLAVYDQQVSASSAGTCNTADAGPDTLLTIPSLPAGTLNANGKSVTINAMIATAANANLKAFGVTVGGTNVSTGTAAANSQTIMATLKVTRRDATHVDVLVGENNGSVALSGRSINLAVSDLSANTLALVLTGTSGPSAANDVCVFSVETLVTP